MTGYDWKRQALRLERENADLRRQLDRAWDLLNTAQAAALAEGRDLLPELTEHVTGLRAHELATAEAAERLERFRKATVVALYDAEDAVDKGADPETVLREVHRAILRVNDRARQSTPMRELTARVRAEYEAKAATARAVANTEAAV